MQAALAGLAASVLASTPLPNRPYVQSMPGGAFYARCVPDADAGSAGTTTIYRVVKHKDDVIDQYDWYAGRGVVLEWSPLAGKIAVAARGGPAPAGAPPEKRPELSFHLGGKLLASYTAADLAEFGARPGRLLSSDGRWHGIKDGRGEQVPGTNEYHFVVELDGTPARFDIRTGKPPAPKLAAPPAAP